MTSNNEDHCPVCGGPADRFDLDGLAMLDCPTCQRQIPASTSPAAGRGAASSPPGPQSPS
jgi:uncharacterized Zn finger protein (UPF0148 family)